MAASLIESCDLTQCSKCHQLLMTPRSLPCLHSYCTSCLEELTKDKKKMACIECGEEFDLPPGGSREWQPLAIVQRMTEQKAMQMALMTKEAIHCTACVNDEEDQSDQPIAVARCTECDDYLCKRCVATHKRQRTMRDHPVFTLDDIRLGKVPKTNAVEQKMCLKHKGEVLLFYCETCDVPICRQCVVVAHRYPKHEHAELEQIAIKKTDELQQLQESCKKNEDEANKALQDIRKVKRDFDQAISEVGIQIKEKVEQLKTSYLKRLDEAKKTSEEELTTIKEKGIQTINTADQQLTSIIARISYAKMITNSLKENGSEFEAASDYRNVKAVLEEVVEADPNSIIRYGKNLIGIKFKENTEETSEKVVLGKVYSSGSRSKRKGFKGGVLKMDFGNVGTDKLGLALDVIMMSTGEIAITDYGNAKIKIFDIHGTLKSLFNTNVGIDAGKSSQPWSIRVAPNDHSFYIADCQSPFVKIFDLQGSYKRYFHTVSPDHVHYNTHGSSKLGGLVFNSKRQVLVGNVQHKFISCHSLDGTHLKSMKVTITPYFLAITSKGHTVVSTNGDSVVQILDEAGNFLTNLEKPRGFSTWSAAGIAVSKKFCIDEDDEELHVADRSGGYVHCYSTSGKYIRLTAKNVPSVWGIALSVDEKTLFAAAVSSAKCIDI